MSEATVTVNGITLSEGEVMTLRVALNDFRADLESKGKDALGADEHGRAMVEGYKQCALQTLIRLSNDQALPR